MDYYRLRSISLRLLVLLLCLITVGGVSIGSLHQNLGALALTQTMLAQPVTGRMESEVRRDLEPAAAQLRLAVAGKPRDAAVFRLMATLFLFQRDLEQAEVWSLRTLQVKPSDPITLLSLGRVYALRGRSQDAVKAWRLAKAAPYFLMQVVKYQSLGDKMAGLWFYDELSQIDFKAAPTDVRVAAAWAYYEVGEMARAENEFQAAVEHAVENDSVAMQALAYGELGIFYGRADRWHEAVDALEQALARTPDNGNYRVWLGGGLNRLGDLGRAQMELSKALASQDKQTRGHAYVNLGQTYQQAGDLSQAIALFTAAIELFPDNTDYRGVRAQAYVDAGRLVEALDEYRVLLALRPADDKLRARYDQIKSQLGQ